MELQRDCKRLYFNPLLIKWFVQAVGRGASPKEILSHASKSNEQALSFCFDNVYESLSEDGKIVIAILLAADIELSRAQIQEISQFRGPRYQDTIRELELCNIVERSDAQGSDAYRIPIGSLVFDYLRRYPADDQIYRKTQEKLNRWTSELDNVVSRGTSLEGNRYDELTVHAYTTDEIVMRPHLLSVLELIRRARTKKSSLPRAATEDLRDAQRYLDLVKEITPNWWEYHRVKAIYLRADNRRIHEIQTAYKDAIEYNEYDELHDVSKYSFAQYLIEEYKENTNYYEALKHIEEAIRSPHANVYDFLVLKARCLLLMQNRLGEAIELYRQIWEEHLPQKSDLDVRIVGTQYADALRRRVGQSIGLGDYGEAWETAIQAGTILDAIIEKSRWDTRTARLGTQLLAQMLRLSGNKESKEMVLSLASKWDSSRRFVRMCGSDRRTRAQFERLGGLSDILPRASANALSGTQTFTGTVSRIADKYGRYLFFNRNSLANPNDWQYLLEGFEVFWC